jgi:hypothetical protein
MLYACAAKIDVTGNLEKFFVLGELNKALKYKPNWPLHYCTANFTTTAVATELTSSWPT